jgi:hypothetical protein
VATKSTNRSQAAKTARLRNRFVGAVTIQL